ncbi:MAG TPA: TfoX/Sxy family protein [Stellaceae bacterium]|nr:TfoX/Sxy family protein [Stellaceae bacterium]
MAVSRAFIDYVRDQLQPWGGGDITAQRMFSSAGLFRGGIMFALVHDDTLYFRTDAENVADFIAAGMAPFSYARAGRSVALGYHQVPAEVIEEPDELAQWAAAALAAAQRRSTPRSRARVRRPRPRRRA